MKEREREKPFLAKDGVGPSNVRVYKRTDDETDYIEVATATAVSTVVKLTDAEGLLLG